MNTLLRPATFLRLFRKQAGVEISRATLYRFLRRGLVRSSRLGVSIWIPAAELPRLIARLRV